MARSRACSIGPIDPATWPTPDTPAISTPPTAMYSPVAPYTRAAVGKRGRGTPSARNEWIISHMKNERGFSPALSVQVRPNGRKSTLMNDDKGLSRTSGLTLEKASDLHNPFGTGVAQTSSKGEVAYSGK